MNQTYPDSITIQPFTRPVSGTVELPGSKSITNRALALAALSRESITLEGALFSDDTRIMAESLRRLGFTVSEDEAARSLFIVGGAGNIPNATAELNVGNAGTAARFLTALLCLRKDGTYKLDGSEAMRKRPMRGLLDALTAHGACTVDYQGEPGHFPFTLNTNGLRGSTLEADASASSQILSALLIIAPLAEDPLEIKLLGDTVSHPFIAMTLAMQAQFGVAADGDPATGPWRFSGPVSYYHNRPAYVVEPDATAASYFIALPFVAGGQLSLRHCDTISLQGDIAFTDIMEHLGLAVNAGDGVMNIHYKSATPGTLDLDFNAISDTFLTLAALTPLLPQPVTIRGIAHTRKQETDRVAAMANELRKLGQQVTQTEDALTIQPDREVLTQRTSDTPVSISTYKDHRVAMSFAILGSYDLHGDGRPWLTIDDPGCCAKTFPAFFDTLSALHR